MGTDKFLLLDRLVEDFNKFGNILEMSACLYAFTHDMSKSVHRSTSKQKREAMDVFSWTE